MNFAERKEWKNLWDLKNRGIELTLEQRKRYNELLEAKIQADEGEKDLELTEGEKQIRRLTEREEAITEKIEDLRGKIEEEQTKDSPGKQKAEEMFGERMRKKIHVETERSRQWGRALVLLSEEKQVIEKEKGKIREDEAGYKKFIEKKYRGVKRSDSGYKTVNLSASEHTREERREELKEILGKEEVEKLY